MEKNLTEHLSHSTWRLLGDRCYRPLFFTQFFGAFNDNAFKLAMLTLISFYLNQSEEASQFYQALSGTVFTIPFFLFSATAGQLADKFNKAIIARWIKVFECFLIAFGSFALYLGNIYLLMAILCGMGIHSTFFGPVKYAILPELLKQERLLAGTALIEASTFIAILLGTSLGALTVGHESVFWAILLTNVVAWLGLLSSLYIPLDLHEAKTLSIDWHFFRATYQMLKQSLHQPLILAIILAISWFWLIGAVVMIKLPDYVRFVLIANNKVFALFLILFSIGIASGSLAINYFLKGKVTLKWVPLALLLMSVFAFDLYYLPPHTLRGAGSNHLQNLHQFVSALPNWRAIVDFFALCFCGGMYIVPCYTLLQTKSPISHRSRTIAANNILNAAFMVLGSLLVMLLLEINVSIQGVFLVLAICNLFVCASIWYYRFNQSRLGK